jgi:predicted DNA binding CopG/RHH family protein
MLSIRMSRHLINAAKDEATRRGIPYSVILIDAIVKLLKDAA